MVGPSLVPRTVTSVQKGGKGLIVHFREITTRTEALLARGQLVYMPKRDLETLPEGSYYVYALKGMTVWDSETGENIGILADVIANGPQDLWRIETAVGDFLLPAVSAFVRRVDEDRGRIEVHLIPGMRPEPKGKGNKARRPARKKRKGDL